MKAKTLKLTAILLIIASAFTACEKIDLLNVDAFAIYANAEGGTFQVAVSSNGAWTAVVEDAENNSWITLDKALGTNNGIITVNIAENPLIITRDAVIKVSMGSLSEYVRVEQEAKNCPTTELLIGKWEYAGFQSSVGNRFLPHPGGIFIEFFSDGRVKFNHRLEQDAVFGFFTLEFRKTPEEIRVWMPGRPYEHWHLTIPGQPSLMPDNFFELRNENEFITYVLPSPAPFQNPVNFSFFRRIR